MLKALQYANALNLIEKELNDMATTTFYLDEEIINQGLPEELESNKGQKGIWMEKNMWVCRLLFELGKSCLS